MMTQYKGRKDWRDWGGKGRQGGFQKVCLRKDKGNVTLNYVSPANLQCLKIHYFQFAGRSAKEKYGQTK